MSVYRIQIRDGKKVMLPVHSREEYMAIRDSEENRRADKPHMVQMNYSLSPPLPHREGEPIPLKGCKTPSNSVGMDIDLNEQDNASEKETHAIRDRILGKKDELGLLMLEESATKGYHLVFRRHPEMTQEENLRWASNLLGVEYDKGAKDVTRVFYTPPSDKMLFLDDEIFTQAPTGRNSSAQGVNPVSKGNLSTSAMGAAPYNRMSPLQDSQAQVSTETPHSGNEGLYLGIPYSSIIEKYWEMFYQGQTPVKSNRDTLTYELANVMKHICGFDRDVLDMIIPCYDGFPEQEKMKCIDSALQGKRTQMPKRLRDVLDTLRRSLTITLSQGEGIGDYNRSLDEVYEQDDLFYYNKLHKSVMVQGIKDSIDAAGHTLTMPTLVAICPCIGARATNVKLDVHGKANTLNLISYIAGDFASSKGQMDDVVHAWMAEDIAMADVYNQQWAEYAEKKRLSQNKKEQPVEPKMPKVWITLNNTTANLAETLSHVDGRHAFSFTPEADVVSAKWKTSVSEYSTMLRQSYDGSSYDREARSVDAVNVHIKRLLWNVVMCGTPDALYRVVNNYTDGFQSRIAVARTPDNTYTPLDDHPAHLTDRQKERIEQVSHLLPLLSGTIVLTKLEAKGREWLNGIILETIKSDDKVRARQRMRVCVTAMRMTCCLMLAAVCAKLIKDHGVTGAEKRLKTNPTMWIKMVEKMQTEPWMELFELIADSLIDNNMYFFRNLIEQAMFSSKYLGGNDNSNCGNRRRKGKNDTIYSRLAQEFTFSEAVSQSIAVKGITVTQNAVRQMLKNWEKQGLISVTPEGNYRKIEN